jgi:predicted nucleotidyltransferase
MTKKDILYFLHKHQPYMQQHFGVEKIGLFGSYAKECATKESDIDFYVVLKEKRLDAMTGLWDYLEEALGKRVDIVFYRPSLRRGLKEAIENEVLYA